MYETWDMGNSLLARDNY